MPQRIKELLDNPKVQPLDACRLVGLYGLRYENHSNSNFVGLMDHLRRKGVTEEQRNVRLKNKV